MSRPVTYDRPLEATLVVRLSNGEEWEATAEDFERFDLVKRGSEYGWAWDLIERAFADAALLDNMDRRDFTDSEINPLRYLCERATYPSFRDREAHAAELQDMVAQVVALERRLRANRQATAVEGDAA